jgi:hypothetical protein
LIDALSQVGLMPTPELTMLYGWRIGTRTVDVILDDIHIIPGFYLLSVIYYWDHDKTVIRVGP